MIIKRLKRSFSGKKLKPGRKIKRVYKNRSRFNFKYLKREEYLIDKNSNEKIIATSMTDAQLKKKTRILKKNNIVVDNNNEKYVVFSVNKKNPSLIIKI